MMTFAQVRDEIERRTIKAERVFDEIELGNVPEGEGTEAAAEHDVRGGGRGKRPTSNVQRPTSN